MLLSSTGARRVQRAPPLGAPSSGPRLIPGVTLVAGALIAIKRADPLLLGRLSVGATGPSVGPG